MHYEERSTSRTSPDTTIEVRAKTRIELLVALAVVIERECAAGEVVTWPDRDAAITADGLFLVASVRLRFT